MNADGPLHTCFVVLVVLEAHSDGRLGSHRSRESELGSCTHWGSIREVELVKERGQRERNLLQGFDLARHRGLVSSSDAGLEEHKAESWEGEVDVIGGDQEQA